MMLTEKDKEQLVDFLNHIAERAQFTDYKTEDIIKHFRLLSYVQQQIMPKVLEQAKNSSAPIGVPAKIEPEDKPVEEVKTKARRTRKTTKKDN